MKIVDFEIPVTAAPESGAPPEGLVAFYWHFIRQTKGWYAAMFAASLAVALLDTVVPLFIGRLVSLMESPDRQAALTGALPLLLLMAALVLVVRPLAIFADVSIRHNALIPGATSLIRWQSHWHVVRQSWPFFQNDFAGRIANRVMQTASSLRESAMSSIRAVWYIGVYGVTAFALLTVADWRLGVPIFTWFVGYVLILKHFVPKLRELSRVSSEGRSLVMGRVVDSYTNILTVKLFGRMRDEDHYVREAMDGHYGAMRTHLAMITRFHTCLTVLNALLLVSTAGIGITLWVQGVIDAGVVATALPLAWQTVASAGWVSWEVTSIFENIGTVQEGMQSIAVPHSGVDRPGARALEVPRGEIRFENLTFAYGRSDAAPVVQNLNLNDSAGRAHRSRRPLRRRQVDAGESVAAAARHRVGPYHDRRPGHRPRDAGEPARRDRHGHAGHVVAASFDRRQYPLRPAERERSRGRSRPRAKLKRTSSSWHCAIGMGARVMPPTSVSAA